MARRCNRLLRCWLPARIGPSETWIPPLYDGRSKLRIQMHVINSVTLSQNIAITIHNVPTPCLCTERTDCINPRPHRIRLRAVSAKAHTVEYLYSEYKTCHSSNRGNQDFLPPCHHLFYFLSFKIVQHKIVVPIRVKTALQDILRRHFNTAVHSRHQHLASVLVHHAIQIIYSERNHSV